MGDIEYPIWEVSRRRGKHEGIISAETFDLIQKDEKGRFRDLVSGVMFLQIFHLEILCSVLIALIH